MKQPIVQTAYGAIQGYVEDGVCCYLGVPYAKPPVGALRFLPPQPLERWEGVRQATHYGHSAPQHVPARGQRPVTPLQRMEDRSQLTFDEDCLTLNIWRSAQNPHKKLPVMYWIHGGGYIAGSSAIGVYNGAALARKRDVLVVTVNYRLGVFGFLVHPMLRGKGEHTTNAGLWDLIAGLQWIQQNIQAFGGDPDCVTVFGESAGSAAVNTLLVCPAAKRLFHRAITQSFSPFNHAEWDHDEAEMQARSLAFLHGCGVDTDEQLRNASTQALLGDQQAYAAAEFSPYVDGDLLPERLEEAFLKGHVHDVPILLGCTADEATVLMGDPRRVTAAQFHATLQRKYPDDLDALYRHYSAQLSLNPAAALARFRSDHTLANMRFYASVLTRANRSPVYFYRFAHAIPCEDSAFFGAFHTSEIPYHFANLSRTPWPMTQKDQALSENMSQYWANFALKGDPNANGLPVWVPYNAQEDRLMSLDCPCTCQPTPHAELTDFLQMLLVQKVQRMYPVLSVPQRP